MSLSPSLIRLSLLGLLLAGALPLHAQSSVPQGQPQPPAPGDRASMDGQVWGALVYASNEPAKAEGGDDPKDFPDLSKRLGKVFPYTRFQVLGQHNQVVFREYESWVVPSRDLFLKLDSKGEDPKGGLNLHVQFWQGQQVLIKTDTVLRPGSPLFIGGPKWRDGQIIFVLDLRKKEGAAK